MKRTKYFLIISLALISCADNPFDSASEKAEEEFGKWKALGISNYTIIQQRFDYFVGAESPVKLFVADNVITDIRDTTGTTQIAVENWRWYKTVNQLFELVIDLKRTKPNAYSISYHDSYHFPTNLYISSSQVSSEAYSFVTQNLVPIK